MRYDSLADWLGWQETLHPNSIELGLERVRRVYQRLIPHPSAVAVITVGGTNGKGSSSAMLDAVYRAAGYRVGRYTSPHLLRYNERIVINGLEVTDLALCDAFARIDQAREDTSLTYFEFGTLAAFDLFNRAELDVVILEVGMGGRLDAVNIIDPDVALITNVGLDHQDWLGKDRESIGFEKAGIMRPGRPVVYGEQDIPVSVINRATELGSHLYQYNHDYGISHSSTLSWDWWGGERKREALPWPALRAKVQLQNAANVLMVLELLNHRLPVTQNAVREGLLAAKMAGRFQLVPGEPTRILDVAHNPESAQALADSLRAMPIPGRTVAVVGMLRDKDLTGVFRTLNGVVDAWYLGSLGGDRGASAGQLHEALQAANNGSPGLSHERMAAAYDAAAEAIIPGDRIVVFGSFYTVSEVMQHLANHGVDVDGR